MAQRGLWNLAKKRLLDDRGALNAKPCTKKTFSAVGLREDVEGKEEERERLNKEDKEKERKSEEREVRKG